MRPKTIDKLFGASCFYYYSFLFSNILNTSWSHTHKLDNDSSRTQREREMCVRIEIALGEFPLFAYTVFHSSGFQVTHKHMVSVSQEQSQVIRSLNSQQDVRSTVSEQSYPSLGQSRPLPSMLWKTLSQRTRWTYIARYEVTITRQQMQLCFFIFYTVLHDRHGFLWSPAVYSTKTHYPLLVKQWSLISLPHFHFLQSTAKSCQLTQHNTPVTYTHGSETSCL